jgi:hypothetical protein
MQRNELPKTWGAAAPDSTGFEETLYRFLGIATVLTFEKSSRDKHQKVQIIMAYASPMEVILNFHSSQCISSSQG